MGSSLRQPGHERLMALAEFVRDVPTGIVLGEHFDSDDEAAFFAACALGLEGIVSKRRDAPCSGRSPDCLKVKNPDAPAATRVMHW